MILLREKRFGVMGGNLVELGVFREWFGEDLPWDFSQPTLYTEAGVEKKWLIAIRKMANRQYELVLNRLRLTKELRTNTLKFFELLTSLSALLTLEKDKESSSEYSSSLARLDHYLNGVPGWIVDVLLLEEGLHQPLEEYQEALKNFNSTIHGSDLKRLGVKEGPEIGRILKEIRLAWLTGTIHTPDEEDEYIQSFIHDKLS
jgi:tRNA nucleotidyltransferase (CCA-adding enzyme)